MGCGASKVSPQTNEEEKPLHANGNNRIEDKARSNGHANGDIIAKKSNRTPTEFNSTTSTVEIGDLNEKTLGNKDVVNSNGEVLNKNVQQSQHSQSMTEENHTAPPLLSKAVAFDIILGQNDPDKLSTLLMPNKPPRRLKKIESAPVLTREALEQKQAAAEQNRQKELEKKVKVMSKRRTELLIAREMDKAHQQKAEMEEKLTTSERNREKHQAEIIAKQRRREEKAKKVRNKAKQIIDGDDVVGLAVDHDETYNADEEDESWDIDTSRNHSRSSDLNDHNNNNKFIESKEEAQQIQNNETGTNRQENLKDVHDFFDS